MLAISPIRIRQKTRLTVCFVMILAISGMSPANVLGQETEQDAKPTGATPASSEDAQQLQYDALTEKLSGSIWKGQFSIDGNGGDLREERYEVTSVTKLPTGDMWLFKARIKYGDHDVTVPLPLKVAWAGKTPMIVVDQLTVPGLGTFDAHVLISGNRYAGTWQHGDVGGHLFGTIENDPDE